MLIISFVMERCLHTIDAVTETQYKAVLLMQDLTGVQRHAEGPAADPQAADDSLQHAANQIAAPGSSFAVTPSRHDADETDVGVVADSSPEAGTEAAAGTDADADMSLQADTSHEADAEADAATEARPDPEAGLSRTGSSAVTAAAAPAAGKSSLDGLSALASLLASAVGKLSSSPADPTPSSETPRDSPADFGPDNDSPRTLSADTLLRSDSHREAFAIPTPGIESPRDSSPDPNPRSDTPKDAGNTSMLNAHSSAEQLDPQQTVPASTHQPAGAVIAQQLSATAHNTGNSNSWTHEPPSAAWGTPKFDGQGAAAPAASGSTAAVAAAKAPIPPSQATGIVNAELAAPSGHAFSQPEQLAAATTAVTAASASKAQGSSNPPLATPSTPQTPEHPPALPAALSLLTTPLTAQNSTRTSNLSQAQHGRSVAPAPTQITATALLSSKSLPPLTIADAVLPSMPSTAQRPSVAPAAVQNGAAPALSPSRARSAGTGVAKGSSSSSGSKHAPLLAAQSSQARAEAMHTLAERVRGMAAQLDALKKVGCRCCHP